MSLFSTEHCFVSYMEEDNETPLDTSISKMGENAKIDVYEIASVRSTSEYDAYEMVRIVLFKKFRKNCYFSFILCLLTKHLPSFRCVQIVKK